MVQVTEQSVFVVDDEPQVLQAIGETLRDLGVEVTCFVDALSRYKPRDAILLSRI